MGDLKGLADVADRLIYEAIGLLLPGTALVLALTLVWFPESWPAVLAFGAAHPWVSAGACYAAGFVVQGISRPVCNATRWALGLGPRSVSGVVGLVSQSARSSLAAWAEAIGRWLRSGHRPPNGPPTGECASLEDLAHEHWREKLGVPAGRRLRRRDVQDLAFSSLGDERARSLRFRSVTSLCRGLAAIVALGGWALVAMVVGPWPLTGPTVMALALFVLVFWALNERADMYDGLWNAIILPQFLATATVAGKRREDRTPAGGPVVPSPGSDGGGETGSRSAADLLRSHKNLAVPPNPGDLLKAGTPAGREGVVDDHDG